MAEGLRILPSMTGKTLAATFEDLAGGGLEGSPLPRTLIEKLREVLFDSADGGARRNPEDAKQEIAVRLLQATLRDAGGPDWRGMSH